MQRVQWGAALNVNVTWEESECDDASLLMVMQNKSCYFTLCCLLQSEVIPVSLDALWGTVVYQIAQVVFEE